MAAQLLKLRSLSTRSGYGGLWMGIAPIWQRGCRRTRMGMALGRSLHIVRASLPSRHHMLLASAQNHPRCFSTKCNGGEEEGAVIYKGIHNDVIRTIKRVSLTTCVMGIVSTPFFLTLGSAAVPIAANVALTSVVLCATCGPTVLLHAFTSPYILRVKVLPGDHSGDVTLEADTYNFITRITSCRFKLRDVKPLPKSIRPFVTFEANGRLFFVHGETFDDKELLKRLVGRPLKPSEVQQETLNGQSQ